MAIESEVTPGAVRQLRETWEFKTDQTLGSGWNAAFADWIERFGLAVVTDAVQEAAVTGYSDEGQRLPPDIRNVPAYATVMQAEANEPGVRECYLARGRMRKKFPCVDQDEEILALLRRALHAGVSASSMHDAVTENHTLEDCFASLGIDPIEFRIAMGQSIVNMPSRSQVFVSCDDPEWKAWDEYRKRTTGVGAPMNKHFGWFFPSRLPPPLPTSKRASR